MKTYEFLILLSIVITGISTAFIIHYRIEEDQGKQGIVFACIFGVGIGICILIEAFNIMFNT
jgi:hypothetical protein